MAEVNRVKTLFILNIILFFTFVGSSKALEVIRDTEIENFTNDIVKIFLLRFGKQHSFFNGEKSSYILQINKIFFVIEIKQCLNPRLD